MNNQLIPNYESLIYEIRGYKVMLDYDLAQLYGVQTKVLKQSVKRNITRFPSDFMFEISNEEKSKLVTNCDRLNKMKHSSVNPFAFTEQGVAMLSAILRSERAIQVNISIMRAFVQLRHYMHSHKELSDKIEKLEKKYDENFAIVFKTLKQMIQKKNEPRKKIGY